MKSNRREKSRYRLVVHVFPEGKTEVDYLQRWVLRLSPTPNVKIIGHQPISTPSSLVKQAIHWSKSTRLAKNEEVWVIFDDDEKGALIKEAFQLIDASPQKLFVAYQKPCIEMWALLHMRLVNVQTHEEAQTLLESKMPKYKHAGHPYFDLEAMTDYDWAVNRAREWEETFRGELQAEASKYAGIYRLTEKIRRVLLSH